MKEGHRKRHRYVTEKVIEDRTENRNEKVTETELKKLNS